MRGASSVRVPRRAGAPRWGMCVAAERGSDEETALRFGAREEDPWIVIDGTDGATSEATGTATRTGAAADGRAVIATTTGGSAAATSAGARRKAAAAARPGTATRTGAGAASRARAAAPRARTTIAIA